MSFAELGERECIQKGTKRFSVRNGKSATRWLLSYNEMAVTPAYQTAESFNAASNLASVKSLLHSSMNLYANERR
jgi:hypothetical protein